jgi:RNA polymerase sigma-70 factor, ECF subfamily
MAEQEHHEEALLRRAVLRGDEDAWRALYDRNFGWLYHYALFRARGDAHAAEDLVQETWEVAVRRMARFDPGRAPFRAWLKGIADHRARNRARREARVDVVAAPDADGAGHVDPQPESRELLAVAMAGLPDRYRQLLLSRYRDNCSVDEIAAAERVTYKAAESLLSRARAAFRRAYNDLDVL